jgi:hypothetical protein
MKAEDLRIGNYYAIAENDGIKYKKVTYLIPSAGDWFSDGDNLTHAAKAIPLTEEWMLKFDFKLFPWGWVKIANNDLSIRITIHFHFEREGQLGFKVKTVHQLQNLYFALTGKELIIK